MNQNSLRYTTNIMTENNANIDNDIAKPVNEDSTNTTKENCSSFQVLSTAKQGRGRTGSRSGFNNAPIGIFDSGFGGLTVAQEIARTLPHESIIYLGDTARFPYGPRSLAEVDGFVQQIGSWLVGRGVKLIVIACNSATAAGLKHAQETFEVPVIGVVDPGARAAAFATQNRRVGVIATSATVESDVYKNALHNLDAGIKVFSTATPQFVEIAEKGLCRSDNQSTGEGTQSLSKPANPTFEKTAQEQLEPLKPYDIDTLVLGCTHFPLIQDLIGDTVGSHITLISSAEEVARDVSEALMRKGDRAQDGNKAGYEFFTTGNDIEEFRSFGSRVFGSGIDSAESIDL